MTVLRNLKRVVERAASDQTLAEVEAGRWPPDKAPILLQSARLATAIASALDRCTTDAEEPARDVVLALVPVLRSMAKGAFERPVARSRRCGRLGYWRVTPSPTCSSGDG